MTPEILTGKSFNFCCCGLQRAIVFTFCNPKLVQLEVQWVNIANFIDFRHSVIIPNPLPILFPCVCIKIKVASKGTESVKTVSSSSLCRIYLKKEIPCTPSFLDFFSSCLTSCDLHHDRAIKIYQSQSC